jgi:hypothetical protein
MPRESAAPDPYPAPVYHHGGTVGAERATDVKQPDLRNEPMKYLFRHPLVVLGLGIAAGYLAHKYRREILATTAGLTEKGRNAQTDKG